MLILSKIYEGVIIIKIENSIIFNPSYKVNPIEIQDPPEGNILEEFRKNLSCAGMVYMHALYSSEKYKYELMAYFDIAGGIYAKELFPLKFSQGTLKLICSSNERILNKFNKTRIFTLTNDMYVKSTYHLIEGENMFITKVWENEDNVTHADKYIRKRYIHIESLIELLHTGKINDTQDFQTIHKYIKGLPVLQAMPIKRSNELLGPFDELLGNKQVMKKKTIDPNDNQFKFNLFDELGEQYDGDDPFGNLDGLGEQSDGDDPFGNLDGDDPF